MLLVTQPLPLYHLDTDGDSEETTSRIQDSRSQASIARSLRRRMHQPLPRPRRRQPEILRETKPHGCLPDGVDMLFAFGALKQGHVDKPIGYCAPSDPVASIRRGTFSAFNDCFVRCLVKGKRYGGYSSEPASCDVTATICELCDTICELVTHCGTCSKHYLVCTDLCLLVYNLVHHHLANCHAMCDVYLCSQLRTELMYEPQLSLSDGLDHAWSSLRDYLVRGFPPVGSDVTTVGVLELTASQGLFEGKVDGHSLPSELIGPHAGLASDVKFSGLAHDIQRSWFNESDLRGPLLGNPDSGGSIGQGNHNDGSFPQMYRLNSLNSLIFVKGIPTGDELTELLQSSASGSFNAELPPQQTHPLPSVLGGAWSAFLDSTGIRSQSVESASARNDAATTSGRTQLDTPSAVLPSVLQNEFLDGNRRKMVGRGSVAYGEPRQLRELVHYWRSLQERLECDEIISGSGDVEVWDGIILTGKDSQLTVQKGSYKENQQWTRQTFLGRGVAGHVYLAIDNVKEFNFVIKEVDLQNFTEGELDVWAELEHPYIVPLYGALRQGCRLYYLCEFYAGGTLAAHIHSCRALDQWKALFYEEQILDALRYLHEKRIIHEDLKADNIYLKPESHVLGIGDFGLSCLLKPGQNAVVAGEHPLGGQTQWSPEKASSLGHGHAADVWAATCTLVHMLSGRHPWQHRYKEVRMLHYVIAQNSPPIEDIPKGLQDDVLDLIMYGWTMDPRCRPTAGQMLNHCSFANLHNSLPSNPIFSSHFREFEPLDILDHCAEQSSLLSFSNQLSHDFGDEGLEYIGQMAHSLQQPSFPEQSNKLPTTPEFVPVLRSYGDGTPIRSDPLQEVLSDTVGKRQAYKGSAHHGVKSEVIHEEKYEPSASEPSSLLSSAGSSIRTRRNAKLYIDVNRIEGASLSPTATGVLRHSCSLDSGMQGLQQVVATSCLGADKPEHSSRGSSATEETSPRHLRHTVTSPSLLQSTPTRGSGTVEGCLVTHSSAQSSSTSMSLKMGDFVLGNSPANGSSTQKRTSVTPSSHGGATPLCLSTSSDAVCSRGTAVVGAPTAVTRRGTSDGSAELRGLHTRDHSSQGYGTGSATKGTGSASDPFSSGFFGAASGVAGKTSALAAVSESEQHQMLQGFVHTAALAAMPSATLAEKSHFTDLAKDFYQNSFSRLIGIDNDQLERSGSNKSFGSDLNCPPVEMEMPLATGVGGGTSTVDNSTDGPGFETMGIGYAMEDLHLSAEGPFGSEALIGADKIPEPNNDEDDDFERDLSAIQASMPPSCSHHVHVFTEDGKEAAKIKLSSDLTWLEIIELLSNTKVHSTGFAAFCVVREDGSDLVLHEHVPCEPVRVVVRVANDDDVPYPWQWRIIGGEVKFKSTSEYNGLFTDNRP